MSPPPPFSASTTTEAYASEAVLAASSCPSCGYHFPPATGLSNDPAEAHRRILDLEAQVRLLNAKATSAVDKLADYEDEIRYLRDAAYTRSQQQQQQQQVGSPPMEGPGPALGGQQQQQQQPQQQLSRLASLSALFPGRRKESNSGQPMTPNTGTFPQNNNNNNNNNNVAYTNNALSPPKTPYSGANQSMPTLQTAQSDSQVITLSSLQSSLDEERSLRQRAETSLSNAQSELEELTAQLFGQANEMVATERKARAKLEERVKVLEQRDVDKRKRLERLEKAITRIERVRAMVGP